MRLAAEVDAFMLFRVFPQPLRLRRATLDKYEDTRLASVSSPLKQRNPLTHTFQRAKSGVRLAGHFPETAKLEIERKKPADTRRAFVFSGGKPS